MEDTAESKLSISEMTQLPGGLPSELPSECRLDLANEEKALATRLSVRSSFLCYNGKGEEIARPSVTFTDIVGHDFAKQEMLTLIDAIHNPERLKKLGAPFPRGFILTGRSGVGKTSLCRGLAHHCECPFLVVSLSDLLVPSISKQKNKEKRNKQQPSLDPSSLCQPNNKRKKPGSSSSGSSSVTVVENLQSVFSLAKEKAPSIILFEEFDTLVASYKGVTGELLTQLDGFLDRSEKQVMVIACVNKIKAVDERLTRAGRFDSVIDLGPPTHEERVTLFRQKSRLMLTRDALDDAFVAYLADATLNFTGAEIGAICDEAARLAFQSKADYVSKDMFENALDRQYLGVPKVKHNRTKLEDHQVAVHEAGHCLIALLIEKQDHKKLDGVSRSGASRCFKVTIVPREHADGMTLMTRTTLIHTRHSLENEIRQYFGGLEAERQVYGQDWIRCGSSSDLHKIHHCILLLARNGLVDFHKTHTGPVNELLKNQHVHYYMETLRKETAKMIEEHRSLLIVIADELAAKQSLSRHELLEIVAKHVIS